MLNLQFGRHHRLTQQSFSIPPQAAALLRLVSACLSSQNEAEALKYAEMAEMKVESKYDGMVMYPRLGSMCHKKISTRGWHAIPRKQSLDSRTGGAVV